MCDVRSLFPSGQHSLLSMSSFLRITDHLQLLALFPEKALKAEAVTGLCCSAMQPGTGSAFQATKEIPCLVPADVVCLSHRSPHFSGLLSVSGHHPRHHAEEDGCGAQAVKVYYPRAW